jgi:hypothetical protein
MTTEQRIHETAHRLGLSEDQVREVVKFVTGEAEQGQWTTKTVGIITHTDGTRHWASQSCGECDR